MVESCSGVSRPFANVAWFVVPGYDFPLGSKVVTGYWSAADNWIVLADASRLDGSVVRHEMLHALIRQSGHPRSAFLEKCAGLVSCTLACVADAGPFGTANAGYPSLPPDSLDVSIEILPNPPTRSVDGGVFSMVISARNRATYPVNISLPTVAGQPVAAFWWEIRSLGQLGLRIAGTLELSDQSVTTFAAGETKRQYFDFSIGSLIKNATVTPGAYTITGAYATRSVSLSPINIGLQ